MTFTKIESTFIEHGRQKHTGTYCRLSGMFIFAGFVAMLLRFCSAFIAQLKPYEEQLLVATCLLLVTGIHSFAIRIVGKMAVAMDGGNHEEHEAR